MPGRAAERIRLAPGAAVDRSDCRERALCRPVGGAPGVRPDRTTAVRLIVSSLGKYAAPRVRFPDVDVGDHLVPPILRHLLPFTMRLFEEPQVLPVVNGGNGRAARVRGLAHVEAQ